MTNLTSASLKVDARFLPIVVFICLFAGFQASAAQTTQKPTAPAPIEKKSQHGQSNFLPLAYFG